MRQRGRHPRRIASSMSIVWLGGYGFGLARGGFGQRPFGGGSRITELEHRRLMPSDPRGNDPHLVNLRSRHRTRGARQSGPTSASHCRSSSLDKLASITRKSTKVHNPPADNPKRIPKIL